MSRRKGIGTMAEDLWKLRKKRGLTIKELANRSGVPAVSIHEYEHGRPVRLADLSRLAKALFVDELEIKIRSDPPAEPAEETLKPPPQPAEVKPATESRPDGKKSVAPGKHQPATPNQITHLLQLAELLGEDEEAVSSAAGKPLESLSRAEMKPLLATYMKRAQEYKAAHEELRPDGTRRRRGHLPEAVDEFELQYLQARQECGEIVSFKLLNGEQMEGRVIGFSPYHILIAQDDQSEVTIHKLALAYYTCRPGGEPKP
jgi:transcriptional regulator with XRE-family HTH domain/sRNA-binding regulator protein Hfq